MSKSQAVCVFKLPKGKVSQRECVCEFEIEREREQPYSFDLFYIQAKNIASLGRINLIILFELVIK